MYDFDSRNLFFVNSTLLKPVVNMKQKIEAVEKLKLKSGRLPYKPDPRTFEVSAYLNKDNLPEIPAEYNWGKKIKPDNWGDMGNLKINDCTCATAGHFIMVWTSSTTKLHKPKYKDILHAYIDITGYNPKTDGEGPSVEAIKTLKYWRKNGIDGYKIIAFAKLEENNREQLKQTIYLYGGCYIGLNLPKSAEKQYNESKKWAVPRGGAKGDGEPGSLFGHAVLITGYKDDELQIVTWGKEMIMTMEFWETYGEESYAVFSEEFIKNEKTPTGIDVDVLRNDLETLQKKKAEATTN